jgi:transcriptional regulator of arginine metabolism
MHKKARQTSLLSLIDSFPIGSQSELASKLGEQGYNVTQASVSRDLDELGVVKMNGHYKLPRPSGPEFGTVGFDTAGDTLIVGRCASGLASAITVKIDAARIPEIVGTIAGDDTIFIAVKDRKTQSVVLKQVSDMFV